MLLYTPVRFLPRSNDDNNTNLFSCCRRCVVVDVGSRIRTSQVVQSEHRVSHHRRFSSKCVLCFFWTWVSSCQLPALLLSCSYCTVWRYRDTEFVPVCLATCVEFDSLATLLSQQVSIQSIHSNVLIQFEKH